MTDFLLWTAFSSVLESEMKTGEIRKSVKQIKDRWKRTYINIKGTEAAALSCQYRRQESAASAVPFFLKYFRSVSADICFFFFCFFHDGNTGTGSDSVGTGINHCEGIAESSDTAGGFD